MSESRTSALSKQWLATTGRFPSDQELAAMVSAELDRDMLFQEALSLELHRADPVVQQRLLRNMRFLGMDRGDDEPVLLEDAWRMELHLGDEVVRRRLIQLMEQLLLARQPIPAITDADLQAEFSAREDEFVLPPRYTLRHVFLPQNRAGEADKLLIAFRRDGTSAKEALAQGAPFLPGYHFVSRTPQQLAREFGPAFVDNLQQASSVSSEPRGPGWIGPVQSTYGTHLVFLEEVSPGRKATLDDVREQLLRDLRYQRRRQALAAAVASLREQYEVVL